MSDNPKKQTNKIENSDISPVSPARAYGVTKKETPLTHFNEHLADIIFVIICVWSLIIAALAVYSVIYMLGAIGVLICVVAVCAFVYFILLRTFRKRLKFLLKLKKVCKDNKIKLTFHRSFFSSFKNLEKGFDFTVETVKSIWRIRFLAVNRYDSALTFVDEKTINITSPRPKGKTLNIQYNRQSDRVRRFVTRDSSSIGFRKVKTTVIPINFDKNITTVNNKKLRNALLINPVPHSMYKKEKDGTSAPTGNGECFDSFTVFTGSGFIANILRELYEE